MRTIIWLTILALAYVVPTASASTPGHLHRQLAELKKEPSVRDVQEAALRYFRVNSASVDSMRSRARIKALAPIFEISGGYTQSGLDDSTLNYEFHQTEPWVERESGGTGWNARAKLTMNLPKLIFNPEELDVASLAGLVEGLLKESTRLYFMRRRLQVDMILVPPTDTATKLSKELRIEELTGLIDAMTGGWFQGQLDQLAQGPANRRGLCYPGRLLLAVCAMIVSRSFRNAAYPLSIIALASSI